MSELLLEIFSEEIPARMQAKARQDLLQLVNKGLGELGLSYSKAETYATPRRLVLKLDGVPAATPDVREERRGPRVGAPEKAIEGFLRGAGVERKDLIERKEKKGDFFYAIIEKKGISTRDALSKLMPQVIRNFPWPKSQRWGDSNLRWVRPLHNIICLLDGDIVEFDIDGILSGDFTYGHRFMAPNKITVDSFIDYKNKLGAAYVMLDQDERASFIREKCLELAAEKGLEWVEDTGLLNEVSGLVEWPVPLIGSFDPSFMEVPEEVLILTMKKDQKYFVTRDKNSGQLAPYFITVSNVETKDSGDRVKGGNERVLSARLSDARFFWDQDLKGRLDDNLPRLSDIVFHEKLGTVSERVSRMMELAKFLAGKISGCKESDAVRAAELAKADLVSNMVYEFPEVQGAMGRYYALKMGEKDSVADAIRDHYAPKGPDDLCPKEPVSVAVALAEKIDVLTGFFGSNMRPTGSKDPFALRRAALGVIRLIVENNLRLNLSEVFLQHMSNEKSYGWDLEKSKKTTEALIPFVGERLKIQQREKGVRHDLIDAVFSLGENDLVSVLNKVHALDKLIKSEDGQNLLVGYKRAANILNIEEQKDGEEFSAVVSVSLLKQEEEIALYEALDTLKGDTLEGDTGVAMENEDFEGAMKALSKLRKPIDAFFDKLMVNDEDESIRRNRLALLAVIKQSVGGIADFSKIES